MLSPEHRQKLDGIVLKMSQNSESPENIQFVVDDFKKKYENQVITPAQASQVAPKEPDTFGGKVAEFGKGLVRDITKPVVQSLAAPAQLAAYGIDKATGGNSPVEDFSFTMPFWGEISPAKTNQESVGRGMKTVAVGAGPVSGGALYMGGDAMEENKSATSVALNTAGGALGGKLGDLALKGVGTVLSKTGSGMQTIGAGKDALMRSAMKNYEAVLGPTTKQNKRITQQITGELAEREITATTRQELFEKAGGQVEKYGEEITEFYKALPENTKVQTTGILKAIDNVKRKLFVKGEGKYIVPEVNQALFKKYQDLQIEIMSMAKGGNAPIEGIRALRQALDKSIAKTTSTFGITGEESIITEARKGVSNILRGELAKQFPDVAVINKEFTFWSRVQQVLGDTIERKTGQGTPLGEKIMTAAGGAAGIGSGGLSTGISTAVGIKYLYQIVKSTAWQTTSAQIKTKLANALADGDGATFGKIVNDLLKASGYVIEKTGNFLKATPGALKDIPRKDIPVTRQINLKQKAKTLLDNVKSKGGLSIQDVSKLPQKKSELTTKLLKDIDGKAFVSKQYMLDATNRPELKQVEKDLIRDLLETEGDKIDVPAFTQKVEANLLPLTKIDTKEHGTSLYEYVSLPSETRGKVKDYSEHIYESPVKNSAGNVHFSDDVEKYFGHTRVEDMAPEYKVGNTTYTSKSEAQVFGKPIVQPKVRRVIEVQSDLFQKGRLAIEKKSKNNLSDIASWINDSPANTYEKAIKKFGLHSGDAEYIIAFEKDLQAASYGERTKDTLRKMAENLKDIPHPRQSEFNKLEQYNNPTAHFRMVREEIRRAADDEIEKLQFPTGETGMKIEGLGDNTRWYGVEKLDGGTALTNALDKNAKLSIGQMVQQGDEAVKWIITDVLGDGKFKAVPKRYMGDVDLMRFKKGTMEQSEKLRVTEYEESFDISGKVDQNNPIYKFYEKELGKYLKNKYKAELVTDKQGVTWMEVTIKPEHKGPVEAFGKAQVGTILAGAAGLGTISGGVALAKDKKEKSINGKVFKNKPLPVKETILAKTNDSLGSFKHDETVKKLADWTEGEASHYDPMDENQTRKGTDGTGAYGRKVKKGSIAFGNRYFQSALKKGAEIYVQVQGMEDVVTPYGKGIFRVDDVMNQRYNKEGKFNIDFHPDDLDKSKKTKGRFPIKFKIVEIKG